MASYKDQNTLLNQTIARLEMERDSKFEELKEYVGEGICYDCGYRDNDWYNVEFKGDIMEISFIN